ncbi:MAG: RNA dependent RNA polymerase [Treponema sp.]|jgi:hypothetical protein|nr:RNA dependent RNA polymerase [Treponema sp.]
MAEDIFDKVFSLFSGDNDPDGNKRVFLRQVLKNLTQSKYAKFFKPRTEEVDPAFAYFLYDLYKTVLPLQSFVQNRSQLERIRQITVEAYLDKTSFEIARRIRSDAVSTMLKTMKPQELTKRLEADLRTLNTGFDANRTVAINRTYNLISAFVRFVSFDFAVILKRFDNGFKVGDPNYIPKFTAVRAVNLVKAIESFRNAAAPLNVEGDWKVVLGIFKAALNGVELIPYDQWQNLILNLRDVQLSNIMDLMIQATLKDPLWQGRVSRAEENLAEAWIDAKREDIRRLIDGIVLNQRDARISSLATVIFGTPDITRLSYYTLKENEVYKRSNLDGFIYAAGLNYLYAFISDYVYRELLELCDILLVRGQWTAIALSREMSEGYHSLKGYNEKIEEFDENLAESGKDGSRLRTALLRVDRDQSQFRYINSITAGLNDRALELIENANQAFSVVGKHLKNLSEDLQKSPHDLVINWKELNLVSKSPLPQRIEEAVTRIDSITQLLQIITAL